MKKLLLLVALVFSLTQLWSQYEHVSSELVKPKEGRNFRIPLIGESAPSFTAESTNGLVNFPGDYGHYWKILFSHPMDFTPVCTTELLELAYLQDEFDKLGVKLVVVSVNSVDMHVQWKNAMENINLNDRGLAKIKFPLVGDENLVISKQYGMIHSQTNSNSTEAVRGVFIIDPDNIVQAINFYPLRVGRSTDEIVRMVTALQATSSEKVMTPANWKAGNDLLIPAIPKTDSDNSEAASDDYYSLAWFLNFKKAH